MGADAGVSDRAALPTESASVCTETTADSLGSAVGGARIRDEASGSGVDERLSALRGSSLRSELIVDSGEGTKRRGAAMTARVIRAETAATWACMLRCHIQAVFTQRVSETVGAAMPTSGRRSQADWRVGCDLLAANLHTSDESQDDGDELQTT